MEPVARADEKPDTLQCSKFLYAHYIVAAYFQGDLLHIYNLLACSMMRLSQFQVFNFHGVYYSLPDDNRAHHTSESF
eukprot:3599849-Amphidinium_carterae.1